MFKPTRKHIKAAMSNRCPFIGEPLVWCGDDMPKDKRERKQCPIKKHCGVGVSGLQGWALGYLKNSLDYILGLLE